MSRFREEKRHFWHNEQLDMRLMHAFHRQYAYPPHSHENYVICVVEWGVQSFTMQGSKYYTPPSGLILINPGMVHTGEPATEQGFLLRSIYPSRSLMERAQRQLTGETGPHPLFHQARVDDPSAVQHFLKLHRTLTESEDQFECESLFLETMGLLIQRHAGQKGRQPTEPKPSQGKQAVAEARTYLEEAYATTISLDDLADLAGFSPYHFLRLFRKEIGMPPHAYLQNVRVHRAQRLIELGMPLAEVATTVGFSSQSHLNRQFKRYTGLTPGRFAKQVQAQTFAVQFV